MSTTSIPTIRYTLRACSSPLRLQRRWARVHDVRFVATQRDKQQVIDRYKEKLQQKAKQEGLEDISQLKEAYKDKITEFRKKANTLGKPVIPETSTQPSSSSSSSPPQPTLQQPPPPPPQPSSQSQSKASGTGIKPLSSYVDLDKLSSLPNKEIEYIWRLRFASDSKSLCAVIPLSIYHRIYRNARTHPQFILPLPRPAAADGSGDIAESPSGFAGDEARTAADIHFLQWGFHPPSTSTSTSTPTTDAAQKKTENTHVSTVLFTHLAAFKVHGSYAQPHTTVTHYLDLADSHQIVLLHGQVMENKGVSADEARWLLMCLQKFYDFEGHGGGIGMEKRQGLLEKFSRGDAEGFKLEELMDEAERVS